MGNQFSLRATASGKVLLSDGTSISLDRPTPVAELMLDHPNEFVFESNPGDKSRTRTRTSTSAPLPADHELDPRRVYVMVPMRRGSMEKNKEEEAVVPDGLGLSLSRQSSIRGWKPSLDPIEEKVVKSKVRHWLY